MTNNLIKFVRSPNSEGIVPVNELSANSLYKKIYIYGCVV